MSDPDTWKPGNPGDLQPWRARRGSSEFPSQRVCEKYQLWVAHVDPVPARNTSASGYGYPADTCIMCGKPRDWHDDQQRLADLVQEATYHG